MKSRLRQFLYGSRFKWAWIVIIIMATIAVFLPNIIGGRTFIGRDMALLGIPVTDYVHQMGRAGKLFLWNPYSNSGLPTVATSMGTMFYPLNIFFVLFNPVDYTFYYFMLHQVIAGLCAFFYLRNQKFSPLTSAVVSLLFAFSATRIYMSIYIEYYAILTFSPLVLMCIDRMVEKFSVKSVLHLSLSLALVVLAGGIHLLLIYMVVFIFYGVFRAFVAGKLFVGRTVIAVLSVVIITVCLTSILLLPLAIEFNQREPTRGISFNYGQSTINSVSLYSLAKIPFANLYGDCRSSDRYGNVPWEHAYIPGSFGLLLVIFAFSFPQKKRRPLLHFFLGMILAGLFLGLGKYNPLHRFLFNYISFLRFFRVPPRFLAPFPLFVLYVSAVGMDNLKVFAFKFSLCSENLKKRFTTILKSFTVFCIAYYILFLIIGIRGSAFIHILLILALVLPLILLFTINPGKLKRKAPPRFVLMILAICVILAMAEPVIFVNRHFYTDGKYFKKELQFLRDLKTRLPSPHSKIFYAVNPGSPQIMGISNIAGTAPLNLKSYNEYIYATFFRSRLDKEIFQNLLYNNFHPRYILLYDPGLKMKSFNKESLSSADWGGIYEQRLKNRPMYRMLCPTYTILPAEYYPEKDAYPRFWFSAGYRTIPDRQKLLDIIMAGGFDPNDTVMLDMEPANEYRRLKLKENPSAITRAKTTHFVPDEIHINLNGQSGWLTLSDIYYPGWTAVVDGKPRPIYRGNYIFRTIPIMPGDRVLELRYESPYFKKGLWLSMATLIFVVSILVWIAIIEKRNRRDNMTSKDVTQSKHAHV